MAIQPGAGVAPLPANATATQPAANAVAAAPANPGGAAPAPAGGIRPTMPQVVIPDINSSAGVMKGFGSLVNALETFTAQKLAAITAQAQGGGNVTEVDVIKIRQDLDRKNNISGLFKIAYDADQESKRLWLRS